jgi:single-strand DNA-binding protein
MQSMNKVILMGHLGRDPELRMTPAGTPVATFSVATNGLPKPGSDEPGRTDWHRAVVFGRTAELCGEYLSKGSGVLLEGELRTNKWTDKEDRPRTTTEVVAQRVHFLPSTRSADAAA